MSVKDFTCPRCGAPGSVTNGVAQYSCTCRFEAYSAPTQPARELTEARVREIVREELQRLELAIQLTMPTGK